MKMLLLLISLQLYGQPAWKPVVFVRPDPTHKQLGEVHSGVRISISSQGPEVLIANGGKIIKGIAIGGVQVCEISGVDTRGLDVGTIYAAIRSMEVATLLVPEAELVLDRAVATSKAQLALDVGAAITGVAALGASIAKAPSGVTIGLGALPVVVGAVNIFAMRRLPSDTVTKTFLLRSTGSKPDWILPPSGCIPDGRVFLYRYHTDWDSMEVILP